MTTDSYGFASATLTVGPLIAGQTAIANACLQGSCASLSAFGARPEFATLAALSGTNQSVPVSASPTSVTLRALDMNGHPMAGGLVTVTQSLFTWTPPCPAHGRCTKGQLLGRQTSTFSSGLDGSFSIVPLTRPGVATLLTGLAATGNASTLPFRIELHP